MTTCSNCGASMGDDVCYSCITREAVPETTVDECDRFSKWETSEDD